MDSSFDMNIKNDSRFSALPKHLAEEEDYEAALDQSQTTRSSDYYAILNLPRSATDEQIKESYRRMCRIFHPDRHEGTENVQAAQLAFHEINRAYKVLSNPKVREAYDKFGPDCVEVLGLVGDTRVVPLKRKDEDIKKAYETAKKSQYQCRVDSLLTHMFHSEIDVDVSNALLFFDERMDHKTNKRLIHVQRNYFTYKTEFPLANSTSSLGLRGGLLLVGKRKSAEFEFFRNFSISDTQLGKISFSLSKLESPEIRFDFKNDFKNKIWATEETPVTLVTSLSMSHFFTDGLPFIPRLKVSAAKQLYYREPTNRLSPTVTGFAEFDSGWGNLFPGSYDACFDSLFTSSRLLDRGLWIFSGIADIATQANCGFDVQFSRTTRAGDTAPKVPYKINTVLSSGVFGTSCKVAVLRKLKCLGNSKRSPHLRAQVSVRPSFTINNLLQLKMGSGGAKVPSALLVSMFWGIDLPLSHSMRFTIGISSSLERGCVLELGIRRLSQSFAMPLVFLPAPSTRIFLLATVASVAAAATTAFAFSEISAGIGRRRAAAAQALPARDMRASRASEARGYRRLMRREARERLLREQEQKGLVILSAMYGRRSAAFAGVVSEGEDVSVVLMSIVENGRLSMPGGASKASLLGFCEPAIGRVGQNQKDADDDEFVLGVCYRYGDELYSAVFGDLDAVICPQESHRVAPQDEATLPPLSSEISELQG